MFVGKAQATEDAFQTINGPVAAGRQRASGLRFADARVQSLLHALVLFRLLANGFRAADLRSHLAALSGCNPETISQGAITYQLRRLRSPWPDRAIAQQLPISRHRIRFSDGSLLHARIQSNLATGFGRRSSRTTRHRWPAQARLRQHRRAGQYMGQPSSTRPQQNLTHLLQVSSLKLS